MRAETSYGEALRGASDDSSPYLTNIVTEVHLLRPPAAENRLGWHGTKNAVLKVLRRPVGMVEIKMCSLGAPMAIATGLMTGLVDAQSLVDQVNFKSVPHI